MKTFPHGPARLAAVVIAACAVVTGGRAAGAEPVDPSVRPGDDFYAYANRTWLRVTPAPDGPGKTDSTSLLRAQNAARVRAIVTESARADPRRSLAERAIARQIADYHAARLDTATVEARGLAPLKAGLAEIAAISDRTALAAYLGRSTRLDDGSDSGVESLFGVWIHQGFRDGDHYAAHLVQGGLGLSDDAADYLDAAHAPRRAIYREHVADLLRLAGFDQADVRAGRVLDLETAIAATHAPRADTDDVFKTDNPWTAADFAAKAPGLDWATYFRAAGLAAAPSFVVWQPGAVTGSAKLVADQTLAAWKDYLAFHLITHCADVLPGAIGDARRAFRARLDGGAASPRPDPDAAAMAATQAAFGDGIGRLYVARHFPPPAKAAAEAMAADLKAAFRPHVAGAAWMDPPTRAKALAKLDALRLGLGYPDHWVDYPPLRIAANDAFGNERRLEAFAYARETAKLARPVDPDEWAGVLHPQMVGAILNLSPNSMQFAAGILQPPYFDGGGDLASNYGSAGAGLAHEVSHSFDDVGNIYDAKGRLGRWQSKGEIARFNAAKAALARQLDGCCPAPDACAHGQQVLGETAADLVGLTIAHEAYLRALHGEPDVVKDGLTGEQRFFIAFAQRWRVSQSAAALQRQIATDSHAPGPCRADLVRNLDAWVAAFGVKPGDALYLRPEDRVRVW